MAKSSALPLLLLAGGAAVMMGKKKKKSETDEEAAGKKKTPGAEVDIFTETEPGEPGGGYIPTEGGAERPDWGMETLVFDESCTKILNESGGEVDPAEIWKTLNPLKFNNYITNKFYQGRAEQQIESADDMTMYIIQSQPGIAHCNWADAGTWTDLMRMTYEDLRDGIEDFGRQQGEWL